MQIADAQREIRTRYLGGFYGQLVSGLLWLLSAALAVWVSPRSAIIAVVAGGFFIFLAVELLIRASGRKVPLSADNSLRSLGMQAAFVLPLSMPLLLPVCLYRQALFYPALMILLGAHYLPFVFLYGMRMFWMLGALLIGAGVVIAQHGPSTFSFGAWYTGAVLLVFAGAGWVAASREARAEGILEDV